MGVQYDSYQIETEVGGPGVEWMGDALLDPSSQPYQAIKDGFERQVGVFILSIISLESHC